jgi:hypothetical protein
LVDGMDAMTLKKSEVLKNLSSWVKLWESWDKYIYHFRAEARCPLSNIHRLHIEVTNKIQEVEYEDFDNQFFFLKLIIKVNNIFELLPRTNFVPCLGLSC